MRRFLLLIFVLLLLPLPMASAQTPTASQQGGCVRTWRHFQSGFTSFTTFFANFNGFFQNACHREDIYALQDQLEQMRASLRSAAYRCQDDNFERLKNQYVKLEMEYQYVLQAFTTGKWNPPWADTFACHDTLPDPACTTPRVEGELHAAFVDKGLLDETTFQEYLTEFRERYAERLEQYKDCNDPVSNDLEASFTRFGQTMKDVLEILSFGAASEEPGFNFENSALRRELEQRERRKEQLEKNAPADTQKDFWDRWVQDVRLNDVPAKEGFQKILEAFSEQLPSSSAALPISEGSVFVQQEEARYDAIFSEASLRAQYEVLYGNSGDEIVHAMTEQLRDLGRTIEATAAAIPSQITPHVKAIHEKQCEG